MPTKVGMPVTLFLLAIAVPFSSPSEANAGPFLDWLFGRPTYYYVPAPPIAGTAYPAAVNPAIVQQPYVAARPAYVAARPVGAPRYAVQRPVVLQPTVAQRPVATQSYLAQRPVAAANYAAQAYAVQPRVVQYAPIQYASIPVFRSMWFRTPVTYYRPVVAPVTTWAPAPTTAYYGGCTTQQWQMRRLPATYAAPAVVAPAPSAFATPVPAGSYPATAYPSQPAAAPPVGLPSAPAAPSDAPSTRLAPADRAPTLNKPVIEADKNRTEGQSLDSQNRSDRETPAAPASHEIPPAAHDSASPVSDADALPGSVSSRAVLTPVHEPSRGSATREPLRRPATNRLHRSLRLLPDPDWRRESPAAPPLSEPEDRTARKREPTSQFSEIMRRSQVAHSAGVVQYAKIARPVREAVRQVSAHIVAPTSRGNHIDDRIDNRIDQNDSGWRSARGR